MSLTSYRAAPPRVDRGILRREYVCELCGCLIFSWPGGDLLFRGLSRSTMGAEGFDGRVRDGIGCRSLAMTTRPRKDQMSVDRGRSTVDG